MLVGVSCIGSIVCRLCLLHAAVGGLPETERDGNDSAEMRPLPVPVADRSGLAHERPRLLPVVPSPALPPCDRVAVAPSWFAVPKSRIFLRRAIAGDPTPIFRA